MNRIMSNIKPSPRTRRQKQLKSNKETIRRDDSSDISETYTEFNSGYDIAIDLSGFREVWRTWSGLEDGLVSGVLG